MSHYDTYAEHKGYTPPQLGPKHVRRLDREIWVPGAYQPDMSVLEVGCGTGLVLAYLYEKGVRTLAGIDRDPKLAAILPASVRSRFQAADIQSYLSDAPPDAPKYDRICMFDVLEHFAPEDGCRLLMQLSRRLNPGGLIHLKVPNAGSPWGRQFQFGDLTHKTGYTPESLRQQAVAAGLVCRRQYPQKLGSPSRRIWEALIHGALNTLLTSPPEIWEGNFYALLEAPADT